MIELLDRQAVIDLFDKYHPYMGTRVLSYEKALKALPTVEAIPVEFIKNEIKDNKGFYNSSLRRLLDVWAERKEE